jgi:Ca-activated chloride channel family protein
MKRGRAYPSGARAAIASGALLAAWALLPACALLAACALPAWPEWPPSVGAAPPAEPRPASVAVEVYGALAPVPAAASPQRVELVLDLTRSMLARDAAGDTRAESAKRGASELTATLRAGTELGLRSLGHRPGAARACSESERVVDPPADDRDTAARRLRALAPRSEASLAAALEAVRLDLEREASAGRTRVVVFTDFEDSCGGDLCGTAHRLVADGAWLEIVAQGPAVPPACLADLEPPAREAPSAAAAAAPAPLRFEVSSARDARAPAGWTGAGQAGEGPLTVPPGLVTLQVQLDPPEEIGPIRVEPGEQVRVTLVDGGGPGLRTWRVERGEEAVGRAFPPPDQLPPQVSR